MRLAPAVLFDDEKYVEVDWDNRIYVVALRDGKSVGPFPASDLNYLYGDDFLEWVPD